jgi:hypothetical protein
MPLELGMAIAWTELDPSRHSWYVWESEPYRLQQSTSDLNGTDPYIHDGTAEGVLRELCNAFRRGPVPSVRQMLTVYGFVRGNLAAILNRNRTRNPYSRIVFVELCWLSKTLTELLRYTKPAI